MPKENRFSTEIEDDVWNIFDCLEAEEEGFFEEPKVFLFLLGVRVIAVLVFVRVESFSEIVVVAVLGLWGLEEELAACVLVLWDWLLEMIRDGEGEQFNDEGLLLDIVQADLRDLIDPFLHVHLVLFDLVVADVSSRFLEQLDDVLLVELDLLEKEIVLLASQHERRAVGVPSNALLQELSRAGG